LAEWVCQQAASGQAGRIALVAATAADARDVLVEGQSGILAVSPPWFRPWKTAWKSDPASGVISVE
jgi:phage terminase large subunit-like protein